jgi:hypothetical protein
MFMHAIGEGLYCFNICESSVKHPSFHTQTNKAFLLHTTDNVQYNISSL